MAEKKINVKLLGFSFLSFALILASYLIYVLIPRSELANSIEHSGMDAVYVLTVSPVLAIFSAVMLVLSFVLNKKSLAEVMPMPLAVLSYLIVTALVLVSSVFSIMFVVSQYDLGFTAPITDTVWQSYSNVILISCIVHLIFNAFLTLCVKGIIFRKSK